MKRSWAALAVAIAAFFAATGCNDYGNTFQSNTGAFLQFVSPANVTAGGPDLTLTLTGSGFVVQTVATWNQKNLKTCVVTTTAANVCAPANDTGTVLSVTAVLPSAMTAKAGTYFVQTVQPHSGAGTNGLSNPVAFVVFSPPTPFPQLRTIALIPRRLGPVNAAHHHRYKFSADTGSLLVALRCVWNSTAQTNPYSKQYYHHTNPGNSARCLCLPQQGPPTVTAYNPPASTPLPAPCALAASVYGGGGTSNAANFTITDPGGNNASKNAAAVQEETPAVSVDGRYVAYTAVQDGHAEIFARDTCQGADASCQPSTVLISSALDGTAAADDSHSPSMSSDGRYVAFSSVAANLVSQSTTGRQVYLRDTCFGVTASCTPSTQLISTDPNGTLVGTEAIRPSVSSSGRFVAFLAVTPSPSAQTSSSTSKSAAASSNTNYTQVFVRDTCLGAANCAPSTTRISQQPGDTSGTGTSAKPAGPAISGSADHVALAGASTATLFTRSIAVDDGVFLALTKNQP